MTELGLANIKRLTDYLHRPLPTQFFLDIACNSKQQKSIMTKTNEMILGIKCFVVNKLKKEAHPISIVDDELTPSRNSCTIANFALLFSFRKRETTKKQKLRKG